MPNMLNLINVLAGTSLLILIAIVVGVDGEVVLSPLYTLHLIPLDDKILVL